MFSILSRAKGQILKNVTFFSLVFGHDCSLDTAALLGSADDVRPAMIVPHDDQLQRDTKEWSVLQVQALHALA